MKFQTPKWKIVKKTRKAGKIARSDGVASFDGATEVARRALGNPPKIQRFMVYKLDGLFYPVYGKLKAPTGSKKVKGYTWIGGRWEGTNRL